MWVTAYLSRKQIRQFFFPGKKLSSGITRDSGQMEDVMGKTKTRVGQIKTNDDTLRQFEKPIEKPIIFATSNEKIIPARIDESELDVVFSDSPEFMELDIEMEFSDDELTQEEDLLCYVGDEIVKSATGIQFNEMEHLIQVMQHSNASQEAERSAVDSILQLNQTELFQQLITQIEGGKQRVADILDKYKTDALNHSFAIAEDQNDDFQQFEITDFL
ncbi:MAG: hypothetical protein P4L34_10435 [Paludibacter sp.]|nr:hypothetical protein [Paludibacter sp.]